MRPTPPITGASAARIFVARALDYARLIWRSWSRSAVSRRSAIVLAWVVSLALAAPVAAQHLPDPARARAADKCHVLLEHSGTKVAVKALKALAICTNAVFKSVETNPGDALSRAGA